MKLRALIALLATILTTGSWATERVAIEEQRAILAGEPGARIEYDLELRVPKGLRRSFEHRATLRGSAEVDEDGFARVDLSELIAAIPAWDPTVDRIEITTPTPPAAEGGDGPVYFTQNPQPLNSSSGPNYHIARNVPGPEFNGLGNNAEAFEVDQHVFVVENTRSGTDDSDGTAMNTGGIAVVLHSDGNDDFSVFDLGSYDVNDHVQNTINRNDHFMTFFREDAAGDRDIVGRIEGISFWDLGEINQNLIDFFATSEYLPWDFLKLDVTFNPPSTWLDVEWPSLSHSGPNPSFNGGSLPFFAYNNNNCEGNANEVCIDLPLGGEIDLTWRAGSSPTLNWGYLDDPFMGLSLNPGSVEGTSPVEFGDPFIVTDQEKVDGFANELDALFAETAPTAVEMFNDPIGFAAKYLFSMRGGVTYESGSGDYAEWLERLDRDETLQPAEIVGVHGGKVSHRTDGADSAMVVSYKPIVLGNMPPLERQPEFEKVAFMGQTLVKVWGEVEPGDYIVPSGRGDGTGVSLSPDAVRADQLAHVVGIAWGGGGRADRLGLVNVAVGLRPNAMARVIEAQRSEIDALSERLARIEARLEDL